MEHMRTTLNLSDDLIKELESISGGKTKTQMFTEALEDYIRKQKKEKLLALKGKINLNYDWRAEEEKELLAVKKERKKYGQRRSR